MALQERIDFLAQVRNAAMAPLFRGLKSSHDPLMMEGVAGQVLQSSGDAPPASPFHPDYVIFTNDVFW